MQGHIKYSFDLFITDVDLNCVFVQLVLIFSSVKDKYIVSCWLNSLSNSSANLRQMCTNVFGN